MGTIVTHALALVFAGLLFAWLEHRWPAEPGQRWWRRPLGMDLTYWFVGPLVNQVALILGLLVIGLSLLLVLGDSLDRALIERIQQGRTWIHAWPIWLQAFAAFLVADFTLYWIHRAFHRVPFLWTMHAVHHSATRLDWLAAVRSHPFNTLLSTLVLVGVLVACGFPLDVLTGVLPLIGLLALLGHANVRWEFGPVRWLFASPHFHRWHHTHLDEGGDRNFANFLPLWDHLFGTWYLPLDRLPQRFGITGDPVPHHFLGQMWYPLRRWNNYLRAGWFGRSIGNTPGRMMVVIGVSVISLACVVALLAPLSTLLMQTALPRTLENFHIVGYRRAGPAPAAYTTGEFVRIELPQSAAHQWFMAVVGMGLPPQAADPGALLWGEAQHPELGGALPVVVISRPAPEPPQIHVRLDVDRVNSWLMRSAIHDQSPWVLRLDPGTSVADLAKAAPDGWQRTVELRGQGTLARRDGNPGLLHLDRVVAAIDLKLNPHVNLEPTITEVTIHLRIDDLAVTDLRSGEPILVPRLLWHIVADQINQALEKAPARVPFSIDPATRLSLTVR